MCSPLSAENAAGALHCNDEDMKPLAIELFQQMSDLTAPECRDNCKLPYTCCSPEYCDMAEDLAVEHGQCLTHTGHPTLKFMGPTGCTVPPHFRPLCTLHTCAINGWGFKPGDPEWTTKYFDLRERIERECGDL